jgi:hypothetical protein
MAPVDPLDRVKVALGPQPCPICERLRAGIAGSLPVHLHDRRELLTGGELAESEPFERVAPKMRPVIDVRSPCLRFQPVDTPPHPKRIPSEFGRELFLPDPGGEPVGDQFEIFLGDDRPTRHARGEGITRHGRRTDL